MQLWDVATGRNLGPAAGARARVLGARFAGDSKTVVTAAMTGRTAVGRGEWDGTA